MNVLRKMEWHPAGNRYTGPIDKAIMSYTDIPMPTRERLATRASGPSRKRDFDDMVVIKRNDIRSETYSYVNLRQMFFGSNYRADVVTTADWQFDEFERGLVYTEDGYSILVPTVCSNVCRVDRVALMAPLSQDQVQALHTEPKLAAPVFRAPEPGSITLAVTALAALLYLRRRAILKR